MECLTPPRRLRPPGMQYRSLFSTIRARMKRMAADQELASLAVRKSSDSARLTPQASAMPSAMNPVLNPGPLSLRSVMKPPLFANWRCIAQSASSRTKSEWEGQAESLQIAAQPCINQPAPIQVGYERKRCRHHASCSSSVPGSRWPQLASEYRATAASAAPGRTSQSLPRRLPSGRSLIMPSGRNSLQIRSANRSTRASPSALCADDDSSTSAWQSASAPHLCSLSVSRVRPSGPTCRPLATRSAAVEAPRTKSERCRTSAASANAAAARRIRLAVPPTAEVAANGEQV